tara:strand:- start:177 stop:440 length:264 start_codon:yes stop_codon:yes gene_type:complete
MSGIYDENPMIYISNYCCSDLFIITESEYVMLMNNFNYLRYLILFLLGTGLMFCFLSVCSSKNNKPIKYKVINSDLQEIESPIRVNI